MTDLNPQAPDILASLTDAQRDLVEKWCGEPAPVGKTSVGIARERIQERWGMRVSTIRLGKWFRRRRRDARLSQLAGDTEADREYLAGIAQRLCHGFKMSEADAASLVRRHFMLEAAAACNSRVAATYLGLSLQAQRFEFERLSSMEKGVRSLTEEVQRLPRDKRDRALALIGELSDLIRPEKAATEGPRVLPAAA